MAISYKVCIVSILEKLSYNGMNILLLYGISQAGIILWMRPANERWRYTETSLIGQAHTQNDPCSGKLELLFTKK